MLLRHSPPKRDFLSVVELIMRAIFTAVLAFVTVFAVGCGGTPTADPIGQLEETSPAVDSAENEPPGFVAQRPAQSYQEPAGNRIGEICDQLTDPVGLSCVHQHELFYQIRPC